MEPVAYHLYKARHFDRKDLFRNLGSGEEKNLRGLNTQQRVFVEKLLKITNAKIIGPTRFENIVSKASRFNLPLDNFIVNLPPHKERNMRDRINAGLERAARLEAERLARRAANRAKFEKMDMQNA